MRSGGLKALHSQLALTLYSITLINSYEKEYDFMELLIVVIPAALKVFSRHRIVY
jgi:hypothetical protein